MSKTVLMDNSNVIIYSNMLNWFLFCCCCLYLILLSRLAVTLKQMQTNALLSLQLSTLFLFNWILHPEFAFGLRQSTLAGVVACILDAVSYINLVRPAGIH